MPRSEDGAYDRLKARIVQEATTELERTRPEYVAAYRAALLVTNGDVDAASAEAKPLLKGPLPKWPALLTAFFDLEVVRGKVARCHEHLKQTRDSSAPDAGYWFAYHLDHWTFQADAFVERCDKLYKQVIRGTIRGRDPDGWRPFQDALAADLQTLKDKLGSVRHPLAHGLGSGVSAVTEHWEIVLAAPFDLATDSTFVKTSMDSFTDTLDVARRRKWFKAIHRANLVLFAYSEAFSGRILEKIESLTPSEN